jgi:hypothetical protein
MSEDEATFEHGVPRGMDGANRDDRIDVVTGEGSFVNSAAHGKCNGEKGSKRIFHRHFDARVEEVG